MGEVTDCKIAAKNGVSRRFCFIGIVLGYVGYKNPDEARKAQKHYNNTYMGTSKVQVEFAKTKDEL
jgi:hypothetical protein